jgi:hypothetical protein
MRQSKIPEDWNPTKILLEEECSAVVRFFWQCLAAGRPAGQFPFTSLWHGAWLNTWRGCLMMLYCLLVHLNTGTQNLAPYKIKIFIPPPWEPTPRLAVCLCFSCIYCNRPYLRLLPVVYILSVCNGLPYVVLLYVLPDYSRYSSPCIVPRILAEQSGEIPSCRQCTGRVWGPPPSLVFNRDRMFLPRG